jgi:hypothetical protein
MSPVALFLFWWVRGGVLAALDADDRARLERVRFELRQRPTAEDFRRGCGGPELGYFWGTRVGDSDGETELPETEAVGLIRIFAGNFRPFCAPALELVLRHEVSHALGASEEDCDLAGLGSFHIGQALEAAAGASS